jgi:hypothetical protein
MKEPPAFPELPDYLVRDPSLLDFVLRDICRAHLERGAPLPADAVPVLCERFLAYGKALEDISAKPRGNPGKNTGRVAAALVGAGWKPVDALARVATLSGQDLETVEKNYRRWRKRSQIDE